jgi:2-polyprenyl-3-methyl-5-hydroxy-6-metoxy-1,4-benzoquinol methylase
MLGTRDPFDYSVCGECGSCFLETQLNEFDLSKYYPDTYYSFKSGEKNALNRMMYSERTKYYYGELSILGFLAHKIKPVIPGSSLGSILQSKISLDASVLDVGCGNGWFLQRLADCGFKRLVGCDPFIERPVKLGSIEIEKCSIEEMEGSFACITFNHSFEHLLNPAESLASARRLQSSGDICIIRIPTTSSEAFEKYLANWVQLDAPRHITIPSRKGLHVLAEACGYKLESMIDDSNEFQFVGSERYLRGHSLFDDRCEQPSKTEIASFRSRASALNAQHRGDQTSFGLRAI